MPAERLTMRKIREVLRLKFEHGLSNRKISKSCSIARSTVAEYLFRFHQADLSWPLPQAMDDTQLEQLLFPQILSVPPNIERPLPDFSYIYKELRRKGVTLSLLWQEYKEQYPTGYQLLQVRSMAATGGSSHAPGTSCRGEDVC